MVGQADTQVPLENVDDLNRHQHARPPGHRREGEALAGNRYLGPRRRLNISHLKSAKTLFQAIEKLPRVEIFLDIRFTESHDLAGALFDFKSGLGGLSPNGAHEDFLIGGGPTAREQSRSTLFNKRRRLTCFSLR